MNAWQTGGYAGLAGDGTGIASLQQQVTVNQIGTEHALRIVVQRGPLKVRIGSTVNGVEYLDDRTLETGHHSIQFTPTGASFYVKFFNQNARLALLDSCNVETGDVYLVAPWVAADLTMIRWDQSADVVYAATEDMQQRKFLRYSARDWAMVLYQPEDGPFKVENLSTTTLTPSGISGNITLTSSLVSSTGIFKTSHVGALFSVTSVGQVVSTTSAVSATPTSSIRVTGVGTERAFTIDISGTFGQVKTNWLSAF